MTNNQTSRDRFYDDMKAIYNDRVKLSCDIRVQIYNRCMIEFGAIENRPDPDINDLLPNGEFRQRQDRRRY